MIALGILVMSYCITECMYDHGGRLTDKLKYDEITLTNKSSIPIELTWYEVRRPQGQPTPITKVINPGKTIAVILGQIGGYDESHPAKIVYKPVSFDNTFTQEFTIDLPNAQTFVFTATKLADMMNNIWVPGVTKEDDKGTTFQYMINDTNWLRGVMSRAASQHKSNQAAQ